MTSTLSGTLNHGITLTAGGAYTSPFTITAAGKLEGTAYSTLTGAVLENLGFDESAVLRDGGTVINAATISNQGLGYGVLMKYGNGAVTNAAAAVIYGGNYGIAITGAGQITNAGSIGGLAGAGVKIGTGTITNQSGAAIYAHEAGIRILNNGGTIINAGAITGNQYGVIMNGGAVSNAAGATIAGETGGLVDGIAAATIANAGTIFASNLQFGTGVKLFSGTLINTGDISGGTGIYLAGGGTIINDGTITAARDAIVFAGTAASKLALAATAKLDGSVTASSSSDNTLELGRGSATLSGLGDSLYGFKTITLDSGAAWQLGGSTAGFAGATILGFTTADSIGMTGLSLAATDYITLSATDVLDIPESANATLAITFAAANAGETFALAANGQNAATLSILVGAPPPPPPPPAAVTLAAGAGAVTIKTAIDTFGVVGTYDIQVQGVDPVVAIGAALFIPEAGMRVTNKARIESDSTGTYNTGILLSGGSTLTNAGTIIAATGISQLGEATGAYVKSTKIIDATIGAGIYLQQPGSALNTGKLTAATEGILLAGGGYALNAGTITAQTGMAAGAAGSTIYNTGRIIAPGTGIALAAQGAAINAGTILAGETGIQLAGGAAYNYGAVTAATGILLNGANAYAYNSGNITATRIGIDLAAGGLAVNYGAISGATGIAVTGGGTVIEYGDLTGATYAASFATNAANRFIIDSTSRIQGKVNGGGGVLELAAGGKTGTIALAGQFNDFATIQIDSGAAWDFAGNFTDTMSLLNNGTIIESSSDQATFNAAIAGAGTIALSKSPLTLEKSVAAKQHINFSGTGETLSLADPTAFAGTIGSFATGDTIDITGISLSAVKGTAFADNILTITEANGAIDLTFASASTFAGDEFVLTKSGAGFAISLQSTTKMAIAKPAATPASSTPAISSLTANYATQSSPTYISPTAAAGFLSSALTPTSAPLLITLHA